MSSVGAIVESVLPRLRSPETIHAQEASKARSTPFTRVPTTATRVAEEGKFGKHR